MARQVGLKVCKNVGRLVHSPQPVTFLSSLVGGVIVGVHSSQPATCLVESCRWGYSGCAYSPQPATCLVESCRWGYSGCAYSPQPATCLVESCRWGYSGCA